MILYKAVDIVGQETGAGPAHGALFRDTAHRPCAPCATVHHPAHRRAVCRNGASCRLARAMPRERPKRPDRPHPYAPNPKNQYFFAKRYAQCFSGISRPGR